MKKTRVIFKILIILIILLTIKPIYVNADYGSTAAEILDEGLFGWFLQDDSHMDINIKLGTTPAINSSKEVTGRIVGMLQVIGSVLSVIALLVIGFRYMFSSLEDRASMKGVIGYYIAGAIMVFATSNLLSVVYNVISAL